MDFIIVIIIYLAFISSIFFTYNVKKRWLMWLLIILPPFFIAPLALSPISAPISLLIWLPIYPFFLGSIISLIIRIVAIIRKIPDNLIKIKLIRPILTIIMFVYVFSYHKISANMAEQYIFTLAKDTQTTCNSNGLCPAYFPGWKEEKGFAGDPNSYLNIFHGLQIEYPVKCKTYFDRKNFEVVLITDFNIGIYVKGGINEKLRAFHYDESGEYEIPIK